MKFANAQATVYNDTVVRQFAIMTVVWGVVGMLVGVIIAAQLTWPELNFGIPWLSYGRLRPLHTNAVIFAFGGCGLFASAYYVVQRTCHVRLFAEKLAGWLTTNSKKGRKERQTLKKMHADLVALGFTGSYARVAAFARRWKADRQREQQTTGRGTFVPLYFAPGEAFQFDWSEDFVLVGGERVKLQVAHIKLSHSRAFLLRAYPLQTHEMLFDAHWHAFRVFGGVPARGIYDNMKTAVDRVGRGKERQINMRFLAMHCPAGACTACCREGRTTMFTSPSFAIRQRDGRKVRSRRTFGIPATRCCKGCRTFQILPR